MDDLLWDVHEDSFLIPNTNSSMYEDEDDDDGISMIFSDCNNIWNFDSVSSGESEYDNGSTRHGTVSSKRDINGDFKVGYINDSYEPEPKKPRSEKAVPSPSNMNFQQPSSSSVDEPDPETITQMKELIYRAAVFRPVNLDDTEAAERPKRKNVKISNDPLTVAARRRRERISEKIRVLQKLVPGGNKMDTASMLDEAASYLKFLRSQVKALENLGHPITAFTSLPLNQFFPMQTHNFLLLNPNHIYRSWS